MGAEELAALLERMPEIATVVNAFKSDAAQARALEALVAAFIGPEPTRSGNGISRPPAIRRWPKKTTKPARDDTKQAPRRRRGSAANPRLVKDLDLKPKSGQSFKEFAADKVPTNNSEKEALAVYFLVETTGMDSGITADYVYTCFQDAGWKTPVGLANSMSVTAHKKGWLDTADMGNVQITTRGRNLVEH